MLLSLSVGNPPAVTGGFPSQRASNAECTSMSWSHHKIDCLIQDCSNFIADALELLQSCTNLWRWWSERPHCMMFVYLQWIHINRFLTPNTYLGIFCSVHSLQLTRIPKPSKHTDQGSHSSAECGVEMDKQWIPWVTVGFKVMSSPVYTDTCLCALKCGICWN